MERFKPSPCGRWIGFIGTSKKGGGLINIINTTTGQWTAQLRVDSRGGVADFAWWSDGEGICAAGKNGEISEWDGRLKRVVSRWTDQGAVGTTVLSLGGGKSGPPSLGGDRWVAIGSSSGVVNLYDRRSWESAPRHGGAERQLSVPDKPKPVRVLDQLTTPISHVTFSADGQLLVIASRWKRDALRLGTFSQFLPKDPVEHCPILTLYQFICPRVLSFRTGRRQIPPSAASQPLPFHPSQTYLELQTSKERSGYGKYMRKSFSVELFTVNFLI